MEKIKDKIYTYIEENLDIYIEELKRLCAQPSVSASRVGMQQMAEMIVSTLKKYGFDVDFKHMVMKGLCEECRDKK